MWRWGIIILAAGVLLGGCDSGSSGASSHFLTGPGSNSQNTPFSPTVSAPTAADDTNVSVCSDGTCEVSVGPGMAIPLPTSTGVKNVKVTAVSRNRVTLTGDDIGNSSSGSCSGQCDGNDSNGVFTVTLGPESEDTENNLSIAVKGFGDGRVVLKFDVAS